MNGYRIRQEDELLVFDEVGGSDAIEHQAGGSLVQELKPVLDSVFKFHFKVEEKQRSSTNRELVGIREGIRCLAERLQGKCVLWRNDNWPTSIIIECGSMKAELHELACDIVKITTRLRKVGTT